MKKAFSVVLSFVLYLLIIFISFLFIIKNTVLDVNFARNQLIESKYTENLIEEIEPKLKSTAIASGFQDTTFKSVLSLEQIEKDIFFEIDSLYNNTTETKNFTHINDEIYKIATDDVKKREIELTKELDDGIKNFANLYVTIYSNSIKLSFIQQAQNFIKQATYFTNIAFKSTFVMILINIIILFILNKDANIIAYYVYSIIASIITLVFLSFFIKSNSQIENIAISSKSLYYLVVVGFNNFINILFYANIFLVILFAILVFATVRLKPKN